MKSRRNFIKKVAAVTGTAGLASLSLQAKANSLAEALNELSVLPPEEAQSEEELWHRIQQAYTVNPNLINLNNGGVSPQPKVVQDAVDRYYHLSNETPSYYMWRIIDKDREPLRKKLGALAGVDEETLAINRNTTEALGTVIFGLNLEKGDEVVLCHFDYPNMMNAWKQREMRDGIQLKWITLDLPIEDEDTIVKKYVEQFTNKTKVVHITHLINWTGQVVPAQKICAEAKKRGILTLVDGAHSFAHLNYKISDFDCDYFGTSLHKWLCAPFGTGLLYVRKERIADLWPLFPSDDPKTDDIRKFENLGTRSFANEMAVSHAIDFHNVIGAERKEARLKYLKDYWVNQVKDHPKIKINTPVEGPLYGALCNVSIDGMEAAEIDQNLMRNYRIHTVGIVWQHIDGVRVTPNVYTKLRDLDLLAEALLKMANQA